MFPLTLLRKLSCQECWKLEAGTSSRASCSGCASQHIGPAGADSGQHISKLENMAERYGVGSQRWWIVLWPFLYIKTHLNAKSDTLSMNIYIWIIWCCSNLVICCSSVFLVFACGIFILLVSCLFLNLMEDWLNYKKAILMLWYFYFYWENVRFWIKFDLCR